MTRAEAIDKLSVAFGLCREELNYQIEAIGRLETQKRKLDEAIKQFKALAKRQSRQPCKSYVSPYAKFDKIRRKRK